MRFLCFQVQDFNYCRRNADDIRVQNIYIHTIRLSKLCWEWKKTRGNESPTYAFKGHFDGLKELSPKEDVSRGTVFDLATKTVLERRYKPHDGWIYNFTPRQGHWTYTNSRYTVSTIYCVHVHTRAMTSVTSGYPNGSLYALVPRMGYLGVDQNPVNTNAK